MMMRGGQEEMLDRQQKIEEEMNDVKKEMKKNMSEKVKGRNKG